MNEKYYLTTFGCQMNVHDSEVLAGILTSNGYDEASSPEEADLILFNTCCVRENAENRIFGRLGSLKKLKEQRPGLIIGVCGCMAQESEQVAKIRKSYPQVDLVFGTHNLHQLPELLTQVKESQKAIYAVWDSDGAIMEGLPVKRTDPFKAWVTIMYGCNNFCAYCIVPYVRGRERSRQPQAIITEVRELVASGIKEVTLLGQNVNSYGNDLLESGWNFARLLGELASGTGIARIRFQTSHPKDLSDELIATIASHPQICRHLHLPIQSGSSRILQLMNRQYTKERYLELVAKLRAAVPGIALTTDIILGFPGELEVDFQDTLDLVKQVRFDGAYTFVFSPRRGTPAAKLSDPVGLAEKQQRFKRLCELQNQISLERNQAMIGTLTELLIDGPSVKNDRIWSGRSSENKLVHFKPVSRINQGDLVAARIIKAQTFTLEGELLC